MRVGYKVFRSKFKSSEIRGVMADAQRNPSVSGSMSSEMRHKLASGSDSKGKYRVSSPGTPYGMTWVKTRNEPAERNLCTCYNHTHDPETRK